MRGCAGIMREPRKWRTKMQRGRFRKKAAKKKISRETTRDR